MGGESLCETRAGFSREKSTCSGIEKKMLQRTLVIRKMFAKNVIPWAAPERERRICGGSGGEKTTTSRSVD